MSPAIAVPGGNSLAISASYDYDGEKSAVYILSEYGKSYCKVQVYSDENGVYIKLGRYIKASRNSQSTFKGHDVSGYSYVAYDNDGGAYFFNL